MSEEITFLQFDPEVEKRPVLPAGNYGADGNTVLDKVQQRPAPWDGNRQSVNFQILVRDPEHGVVRVFQDLGLDPGSQVPRWMRQLGMSDEQMRAGFDANDLKGMKVIATLGIQEFISKKELDEAGRPRRFQKNTIENLVKF